MARHRNPRRLRRLPPAPAPLIGTALLVAGGFGVGPAVGLADGLAAQERADTTRARDSIPRFDVDPLVVTVSKLPVTRAQAGFSVSVLTPGELEVERPVYAEDAIRELPGVFIDEAVGPGGPSIVRLRGGEEVFTQILMDGVPVNENGGFFDFQGVTLSNLARIEVARGPQSALHGSSAVSGVVHLVTRRGVEGPARVSGTVEGGGDAGEGRSFRAAAEVRGGDADLLYSGGAGVAWNRGIHELPHDTRTLDGSLRVDARASETWTVTGIGRWIGVDSKHPVRDAGVTRVPLDPNAELERNRLVLEGSARHDAGGRWSHTVGASLFRQDFVFADERDDITPPEGVFVTDATFTYQADLWRGAAEYVGRWRSTDDPAESRLAVAFGTRAEREDLATRLAGDFGDASDDFVRDALAGFVDVMGSPHPRVSLLVGARVEKYEGLSAEITPRGSVTFAVRPGVLALRAAAGRAYKVPNLQNQFTDNGFILANPDLRAESSVSWEAGADVRAGDVTLSATGFLQEYDDLIRTVPVEGDEQNRNQHRNVGESRAWGVEAGAGFRLAPEIRGELTFTRSWTEVIDNTGLPPEQYPEGEELPFRSGVLVSGLVEAGLGSRADLALRATHRGSQIVLENRFSGDRVEIDGYTVVDATLNVAVTPRATGYVKVRNLLDTTYQTAFDRPGLPATAVVGVRLH